MFNLLDHAETEFKAAGWLDDPDLMQAAMMNDVRELLRVFAEQGHSGTTATATKFRYHYVSRAG